MKTLHTVNKSPFTDQCLGSCLAVCAPGDSLLLIEDGTYGALSSAPTAEQLQQAISAGVAVYALTSDTAARGLTAQLAPQISLTDYPGFVQLSCKHHNIQSWY
jgi:tRNA 2-thiouridine synthesizing protein B